MTTLLLAVPQVLTVMVSAWVLRGVFELLSNFPLSNKLPCGIFISLHWRHRAFLASVPSVGCCTYVMFVALSYLGGRFSTIPFEACSGMSALVLIVPSTALWP